MEREPTLNHFGAIIPRERNQTQTEWETRITQNRNYLRESIDDINWTVNWLTENIASRTTINSKANSGHLKHIAERRGSPRNYLSNGVLIAAAIIAGYPYKFYNGSPNACFGMSQNSLKILSPENFPDITKKKELKSKPNHNFQHPLEEFALKAFEERPCHDSMSLSLFLSGGTWFSGKVEGVDPNIAYKLVAKDILGLLEEKGMIKKDSQGWFRLTQIKSKD